VSCGVPEYGDARRVRRLEPLRERPVAVVAGFGPFDDAVFTPERGCVACGFGDV
jgi:hypothetical protein